MSILEDMARATYGTLEIEGGAINAAAMVRAALAEAERRGWVLVPKEPTPTMMGAGENTIIIQHRRAGIALEELSPSGDPHGYCGAIETYREMLRAAPKIE